MTEWDHHGTDHHGADAEGWDHSGADVEPTLPEEPTPLDDAYDLGAPDHDGGPEHGDALPDEPAGLPAEGPADWTADHALPEPDHADPPDPDPGTDPAAWTDGTGAGGDPFPPALDMDVTPAGGGPWTDPELIGGGTDDWSADPVTDPPAALLPDLAAADGDPDASWASLRDSDDPAVRALATHWHG